MSTDLPENAIDLGVHESIVWPEGEAVKTHLPGPHRIVAIPVPAPEPPSLAERMAMLIGDESLIGELEIVVAEFGLVCRDEVPTVTQVMEALGWLHHGDYWHDGHPTYHAARAAMYLTAIGVRPDQEPDT